VDLLPDPLQVVGGLFERVGLAVEVEEVLGAAGLSRKEVVQAESERLRQLPDLGVSLVDQLAAVLGDLRREVVAKRPAATADPVRCLVYVSADTGLLELVGAAESGEPRSHHDNSRRARRQRPWQRPRQRRRQRQPGPAGDHFPASHAMALLDHLLGGDVARRRLGRDRGGLAQSACQRRSTHLSL
jgi:hypothetical protein